MAIFDTLDNLNKYIGHYSCFNEIFEYLSQSLNKNSLINQRICNYPIGSNEKIIISENIFAIEQKFNSKLRNQSFLESHQKHIDIQFGISGKELMEHTHISNLEIAQNKLEENDLIIYKDYIHTNKILIEKGYFAIYYPDDAHMGGLFYQEPELCIKTVVKVPIEYSLDVDL
jgi:YhcH/YjgK/YiaL family protein